MDYTHYAVLESFSTHPLPIFKLHRLNDNISLVSKRLGGWFVLEFNPRIHPNVRAMAVTLADEGKGL